MANFRRRMRPMLGTFVEVGVATSAMGHDTDKLTDTLIDNAFLQIERVQALLNRHDPSSELSRLNSAAGEWTLMSRISLRVLRLARRLMQASDGRFNFFVPGDDVAIGKDQIEIQNSRVRMAKNAQISLDGIAKGFAVDRALKSLKNAGACAGWVNAGGDLRVFGELELPIWRREQDGGFKPLGHLKNAAFATSQFGDERFPGKIEGSNGYYPQAGVWSVLAPTTWLADALTKVACVSAEHERAAIITRLGGYLVHSGIA